MSSSSGVGGNLPGAWSTVPLSRSTGSLSPLTGSTSLPLPQTPALPTSLPAAYQASAQEPQLVQFGAPAPAQMMRSLLDIPSLLRNQAANDSSQLPPVPEAWRPRLEALARELGFSNFQSLQYQLRNLPTNRLDQWLQETQAALADLPVAEQTPAKLHELLRQELLTQIETATQELFTQAGAPAPVFQTRANRQWSLQARLAIYNAFSEIRQTQSLETFRRAAQGENGKPIQFVRAEQLNLTAFAGSDSVLSAMEMLSGAMKVAYHDHANDSIVLHDGAIHTNPRELLKDTQIQEFIQLVNSPGDSPEKQRALRSVQEMLNYSRTPQRQLPLSGKMDSATQQAIQAFDLQQSVTAARDIIEDDTSLTVPQKRRLIQRLTELQGRLDMGQAPLILKAELGHTLRAWLETSPMQPASRERLENQLSVLDRGLNTRFDQRLLEGLINNWYGIIDGGQQRDFTEQVVVHELGHGLQAGPEMLENWRRISWDGRASETGNRNNVMGETLQAIGKQGFVSEYARVNDEEDFAESYRVFTYQPERLLQHSLMKFMFMAAVTQAYQGREQEMLDLVQKAGYNQEQMREALLQLRGHLPSETRQYVKGVIDKTMIFSKVVSPLAGLALDAMSRHLGLREKIADWWADVRGVDQKPQFTPRMAAALPELDRLLRIDSRSFVCSPSESGYVLDQMTRFQALLAKPDATFEERTWARQKLEAFRQQGLEAWDDHDRRNISHEVQHYLSGPNGTQNRAVVLALSKILGKSYAKVDWETLPNRVRANDTDELRDEMRSHRQISSLNAFFEQVRRNPEVLRQELGPELYQALPDSFKAILMEPDFVENITGKRGETAINASNIFDYTMAEMQNRQRKSGRDYLVSELSQVLMWVSKPSLPQHRLEGAYGVYVERLQIHNQGTTQKSPVLSFQEFEAAVKRFRSRLQTVQAAPLNPLDTSRTLTQDQALLQDLLLNELGIRLERREER